MYYNVLLTLGGKILGNYMYGFHVSVHKYWEFWGVSWFL
jgi:hypothetical protein